ncbi:MAG TPA: hypothetical protein VFZ45_02695, partial [Actinomycetota bacterium]|nr:hypothetical protein [Actinomycetota bacterium]
MTKGGGDMAIGKKLLALFAGGSAVGIGAAAAGVSSPDSITPSAVELGDQGSSLNIEGDEVRVEAQASPLDDVLDSASTAGSPDTPGTEDVDTAGTNSANTASPDTATADSPDNSGPGSFSSGPGSGVDATADTGDDNSGPNDNSGPGTGGDATADTGDNG